MNCESEDLALIENATSGVNTILRSLEFNPGDEIIVTNHTYQACRNSLDYVAKKSSAIVVVCEIPFPVESSQIIFENMVDYFIWKAQLKNVFAAITIIEIKLHI